MSSRLIGDPAPSERSREVLTFLAVGGFSALVNFLSGAAVRVFAFGSVPYVYTVGFGFAVGTVVSFFLNRRFTFRVSDEPALPQAVRFGLLALASWFLGAGVAEGVRWVTPKLFALVSSIELSHELLGHAGHIGSIGLVTVFNFFGMKLFAMRRTKQSDLPVIAETSH